MAEILAILLPVAMSPIENRPNEWAEFSFLEGMPKCPFLFFILGIYDIIQIEESKVKK